MSKLKTTKRKLKHLKSKCRNLVIDYSKMVMIKDVVEWINNQFQQDFNAIDVKEAIDNMRLERSKNSFYEHCIQPYSGYH
jgi:NH3-dependent NAD+ synthetase